MTITTIDDVPTPPARADGEALYNSRMIALVAALATRVTQMNTQSGELDDSGTEAAAAAAAGVSASGAQIWVTGTTYAQGDKRWSPIDYKTYRRKTNGAGSADPSADSTNWALVSGTGDVNLTAIQTVSNKVLVDPDLEGSLTEKIYEIPDGASVDIDPANGKWQSWTLGAARTPTANNFANGQSVILDVADGAAYAVTWTIVTSWLDDFPPVLPTTGYARIKLWKMGGLIYGAWMGNL